MAEYELARSHLPMLSCPSLRSVLREEVQSGAGQQGVLSLLRPQQCYLETGKENKDR